MPVRGAGGFPCVAFIEYAHRQQPQHGSGQGHDDAIAPTFVGAAPQQQTTLLDLIAYRKNESPATGPGIKFFEWARRMVVDAYYTSPVGIKAIGYMGNTAVAKFEVPQEAIDYAMKRSPV